METFPDLLTHHVIELQSKQGRLIKQKELAQILGVGETSLNLAWNGKRPPSDELAIKCAEYFQDPRFYDIKDLPRPEPYLDYLKRNWEHVPKKMRKQIAEQLSSYTTEKPPKDQ
jgi:DNA-binding XRE family transcriptional regulator